MPNFPQAYIISLAHSHTHSLFAGPVLLCSQSVYFFALEKKDRKVAWLFPFMGGCFLPSPFDFELRDRVELFFFLLLSRGLLPTAAVNFTVAEKRREDTGLCSLRLRRNLILVMAWRSKVGDTPNVVQHACQVAVRVSLEDNIGGRSHTRSSLGAHLAAIHDQHTASQHSLSLDANVALLHSPTNVLDVLLVLDIDEEPDAQGIVEVHGGVVQLPSQQVEKESQEHARED